MPSCTRARCPPRSSPSEEPPLEQLQLGEVRDVEDASQGTSGDEEDKGGQEEVRPEGHGSNGAVHVKVL